MSIPTLDEPLEFLNNVDLDEPFEFTTDGVAEDFSMSVIRASFVDKGGNRLDMSTLDGTIVKTSPGKFQLNVDKLVMWLLPAGGYNFDIVSTNPAGQDAALLRGKVKLVKGATAP
jgi:hypothetical protein